MRQCLEVEKVDRKQAGEAASLPLISIITPCYNSEQYIAKTIESVLAQTYTNWEMLITDDCSTDRSLEIVQSFAKEDKRIKIIRHEQNCGTAKARNTAIEASQGEYLAFLDSDDLWLPQKLEKQLSFMQKESCDFCFARYEHIDEKGNPLGKTAKIIKKLTYKQMMLHCFTGCLTVMYKQDLNNKIYSPDLRNCNDYALFLKVLKHKKNAMGYNENLAKYRIVKNSLSRNKMNKLPSFIEMMTKHEKQNILSAYFLLFTNQFIKVVWKYEKKGAS
ncbi:MAG: glycosyltransferase family 2 protein [Chitinispirillia bacterium]|nr:glycosyltransferase family 2 protein [Chitinispirillia bacterium]